MCIKSRVSHLELSSAYSIADFKIKNQTMRMCSKIKMAGNSNVVKQHMSWDVHKATFMAIKWC